MAKAPDAAKPRRTQPIVQCDRGQRHQMVGTGDNVKTPGNKTGPYQQHRVHQLKNLDSSRLAT